MQLFAGELTNQNQEYYKVNDNKPYCPIGTFLHLIFPFKGPQGESGEQGPSGFAVRI